MHKQTPVKPLLLLSTISCITMGLSPFSLFIWTRFIAYIGLLMIVLVIGRFLVLALPVWLFEQGPSALSCHTQGDALSCCWDLQLPKQPCFFFFLLLLLSLKQIVWQVQFLRLQNVLIVDNPSSYVWLIAASVLLIYRPPELAYKYGNLSEGTCKPGYAAAKMTTIYPKWEGFFLHLISHNRVDVD